MGIKGFKIFYESLKEIIKFGMTVYFVRIKSYLFNIFRRNSF